MNSEPTQPTPAKAGALSEIAPFLAEMKRMETLRGANLEAFARTFVSLAEPEIRILIACRDHWKISFEHEREQVIRLRELVHELHMTDLTRACRCDDCRTFRQHSSVQPKTA